MSKCTPRFLNTPHPLSKGKRMNAQRFGLIVLIIILGVVMLIPAQPAQAISTFGKNDALPESSQPLLGAPSTLSHTPAGSFGAFELSRAEFSAFGEFPLDGLGYHSLSFIGDINHDGFDDFAVGAFMYDGNKEFGTSSWGLDHGCGGYDPGALYIVLGRQGGFPRNVSIREAADLILVGFSGYFFGRTFTTADLNTDGIDDLVVAGGTHTSPSSLAHGSAYIIWGRNVIDWNAWMSSSPSLPGSTCFNPDVDPNKVKNIDWVADASLLGTDPDDRLGFTQMGSADVNGDGYLDLLASSIFADTGTGKTTFGFGNGVVYVILGDASKTWILNKPITAAADAILKGGTLPGWMMVGGVQVATSTLPEMIGGIVAGVDDVTGDGKDDFLVSSWQHMFTVNMAWSLKKVYLISGASIISSLNAPINTVALTTFSVTPTLSTAKENNPGWAISGLGDINQDGIPDFGFSDPWAHVGFGNTYVFYGRNSSNPWPATISMSDYIGSKCGAPASSPDILLEALQNGTEFGYTMAGVGDVDHDGHDDFVVTSPTSPGGGADVPDNPIGGGAWGTWYSRGDVYLFFGNSGLLNPCDWVVQSERYALPNVAWFAGYRSQYVHIWGEETGYYDLLPNALQDRNNSVAHVSIRPGDFNGDGIDDILLGDHAASARETCMGIDMVNNPESAQCGLGKVYLILGKSALNDTPVPELWVRDTSLRDNPDTEDIGNEPNLESDVFNESPDLWVRLQNDQLRGHEVPTISGQTVYVNLRVTNSGNEWTDGTETVDIYYTTDRAFDWPGDFSSPTGDLIGTVTAHPIGPGDRKVFTLSFAIPSTIANPSCLSFLAVFDGETQTAHAWDDVKASQRIVARSPLCNPTAIQLQNFAAVSQSNPLIIYGVILIGWMAVTWDVIKRRSVKM